MKIPAISYASVVSPREEGRDEKAGFSDNAGVKIEGGEENPWNGVHKPHFSSAKRNIFVN